RRAGPGLSGAAAVQGTLPWTCRITDRGGTACRSSSKSPRLTLVTSGLTPRRGGAETNSPWITLIDTDAVTLRRIRAEKTTEGPAAQQRSARSAGSAERVRSLVGGLCASASLRVIVFSAHAINSPPVPSAADYLHLSTIPSRFSIFASP